MKKPLQTFPETAAAARQQSQPAASGAVPADGTALPVVSVFPPGRMDRRAGRAVLSCVPSGTATVADLWHYIRGPVARAATAALRAEPDAERQRRLKALTLSYCTPFGTFSYRNTQGLLRPSGMMVADFDHIDDPLRLGQLRQALIDDPYYQTDLLFVSPRGHGLKWFVHVGDLGGEPLRDCFRRISRHVQFQYGYIIDESGKDIPRPCYLSHDPDCYLNPLYLPPS